MIKRVVLILSFVLTVSTLAVAQNTNSSTTKPPRPRTTNTNKSAEPPQQPTDTEKPAAKAKPPSRSVNKPAVTSPPEVPGSTAVIAAFDALLDGIRHADVKAVTNVYWNSPRLILFNNNGTLTRGWEQMRKNRESSYPELKDVVLDVRDVAVTMLGRDGAVVTCMWTQTQTYKGAPESASGRMTLVFKRLGNSWKAIHLHTSTDKPNPASILPSEQTPSPKPFVSPTP